MRTIRKDVRNTVVSIVHINCFGEVVAAVMIVVLMEVVAAEGEKLGLYSNVFNRYRLITLGRITTCAAAIFGPFSISRKISLSNARPYYRCIYAHYNTL